MNVGILMQKTVMTVRQQERLDRAAELLRNHDCGSVVVVDAHGKAVGMVTDRDVCLAALRGERPIAEIPVESAMSKRLFTCAPEDSIAAAQQQMALHQVRRLPVVDQKGRLRGLLALDDVARAACRDEDLLAPPVSCAAVGRTLGQITRPRLIETPEAVAGT